jgi:hypothetical protein
MRNLLRRRRPDCRNILKPLTLFNTQTNGMLIRNRNGTASLPPEKMKRWQQSTSTHKKAEAS